MKPEYSDRILGAETSSRDRDSAAERNRNRIVNERLALEPDIAFRRRLRSIIQWLPWENGLMVGDIGTGLGHHAALLVELGANVLAVEPDAQRMASTRTTAPLAVPIVAALPRLPFRDSILSSIVCSEVLEHVDDDAAAIREIGRVLAPGGTVVITVPHARFPFHWDPINRMLEAIGREPIRIGPFAGIWTQHKRLYEPAELSAMLEAHGLTVQVVQEQSCHGIPFSHLLIYVVGKSLLERGFGISRLTRSFQRLGMEAEPGANRSRERLNPVLRTVSSGFALLDRWNDRSEPNARRFVSILVVAVKIRSSTT